MLWIFDKYIDTNLISSYHKRHQKITFISKGSIPSLASRMRRKTVVIVAPAAVRRHRRRKITFISKGLIPSSRWGMTVGGTIVARVVAVVVGAEEAVVVARVAAGAGVVAAVVVAPPHRLRRITFTLKGSIPSSLARVAAGVGVVAAVVVAPPHRLRNITFTLKELIPFLAQARWKRIILAEMEAAAVEDTCPLLRRRT